MYKNRLYCFIALVMESKITLIQGIEQKTAKVLGLFNVLYQIGICYIIKS